MGKSTIEERDGQTVLVTPVSSEAAARRLSASIRDDILRTDGDWGQRMRARIDQALQTVSLLVETVDRSFMVLMCCAFAVIAAILAARSWPALIPIPRFEWLMSIIGMLLIAAIAWSAHQLWRAWHTGQRTEFWGLLAGIVLAIVLNAIASISLQSQAAVEKDTGWRDARSRIDTLRGDRGRLAVQIYDAPPAGKAAQLDAQIQVIRAGSAVNRLGDPLKDTVGALVKDCRGPDDYYKGKYCPEIVRLEGEAATARAAEKAHAEKLDEIAKIDAEIKELEAGPTKPQTALSLARLLLPEEGRVVASGQAVDVAAFLPGLLVTVVIELLTVLFAVLAGRRVFIRRSAQ